MFITNEEIILKWILPASSNNFNPATEFKMVIVNPFKNISEDIDPATTYASSYWTFNNPTLTTDGEVTFAVTPNMSGIWRYRLLTTNGATEDYRLLGEIIINVVPRSNFKIIKASA